MQFNENRSKDSGYMERIEMRVNYMTMTCDLDIESRLLGHALCILPHYVEHLGKV